MKNTDFYKTDDTLYICLLGNISSANAPEIEEDVFKILQENPGLPAVIDAEKLEYISSAGLRIILKLRKAEPELKIINVSTDVYEVFDMTGFTEILPVEKAYRKLSVDGCEVIGSGSNGIVYRYDPETIVKLYRNKDALDEINRERSLSRKAFVSGINTAIPYDVVKIGENYGAVYELLDAASLSQMIAAHPEKLDTYITLLAELLKKIHSVEMEAGELPQMKPVAVK